MLTTLCIINGAAMGGREVDGSRDVKLLARMFGVEVELTDDMQLGVRVSNHAAMIPLLKPAFERGGGGVGHAGGCRVVLRARSMGRPDGDRRHFFGAWGLGFDGGIRLEEF